MSEETKNTNEGSIDKDQERAPTAEERIKGRVEGAIAGEVYKLEVLAERLLDEDRVKDHCQAMETIASIRARAEMYCIQLEMAAQTAAMASLFGGAMRQQQQAGVVAPQDIGDVSEVLKRAKRPGGNSPQGD